MAPTFCKGCIRIRGLLQCNCGEDRGDFRWCWSNSERTPNLRISENSKDILFHPLYSSGTAVVRGGRPFEQNMHHYWEIKIMSNMYGTDVMIGIGTQNIVLSDWMYRFNSMLGKDSESWGYSYRGKIQHNNMIRKYGTKFGQGTLVGVHMNMYNGTLEYHINRKPVGIAFTGLRNRQLYPMVSSTAAQSSVRIVCSVSEEATLQMQCLQLISKYPALYKKYKEIPGLARTYEKKYYWIVPTDEEGETKKRPAELKHRLTCPRSKDNVFQPIVEFNSFDEFNTIFDNNASVELMHPSEQDCNCASFSKRLKVEIPGDSLSVNDSP